MKFLLYILLLVSSISTVIAQDDFVNTAQWSFKANKLSATEVEVIITIQVPPRYYIPSFDQEEGGGMPTRIIWDLPQGVSLDSSLIAVSKPIEFYDQDYQVMIKAFYNTVIWKQRFIISENVDYTFMGSYEYQLRDATGFTTPFVTRFKVFIPRTKKKVYMRIYDENE